MFSIGFLVIVSLGNPHASFVLLSRVLSQRRAYNTGEGYRKVTKATIGP